MNAFGGPEAHMWSLVAGRGGATIKSVQRGTTTLTAASTVFNIGIMSVNSAMTIVTVSIARASTDTNTVGKCAVSGRLTSATDLRLGRFQAGGSVAVTWEATEFLSGISIQQIASAIDAVGSVDVGISSVNMAKTFLVSGGWECTSVDLNGTIATYLGYTPRVLLTSGTSIHLERGVTTNRTDVVTFVMEVE